MPVERPSEGPSDAALIVMTEAEYASMRSQEGARIVQRDGRFWEVPFPGFYQPVHWLARFRAGALKRPDPFCWGYRAALGDEDSKLANGSVPVHLQTNVDQFTENWLNRNRLRDLRVCRRKVELRLLRDPALLIEQGYGVFRSAQLRVPFGPPVSREAYTRRIAQRAADSRRVFIAGMVDGRLGGYLESYAVDGVLYTHELFVATEFMASGIGTGLYVETMAMGARSGTVREICYGIHTPERVGITSFKASLGSTVVQVPARVAIPAPIRAYLRFRRPMAHYRLTGVKPSASSREPVGGDGGTPYAT